LGDGWHATNLTPEAMAEGVQHLKTLRTKHGRAGEPVISVRAPLFIEGVSQEELA
jgi:hypothetical protein